MTTPAGIADELRPLLRMTVPPGLGDRTVAEVEPGERLGRAWLLLGGLLPVDYDDLRIVELEPPRRFLERSSMLSLRRWEHERTIEPLGAGRCTITDRLGLEPRSLLAALPRSERLAAAITGRLFEHRHRRLRRRFGTA